MSFWILAASAAAATAAPSSRYEDVQIGSVVLRVPFPNGYCKPKGERVASFQVLAAGDKQNVTLLSLVECKKGSADRYLLVKSPMTALNTSLDRAETLSQMAAAMETPEFSDKLRDMPNQIEAAKTAVTGIQTKVRINMGPRGHDETCVYAGGLGTTSAQGEQRTQAVGACMTVIGSRFLSLNAYADSTNPERFKALLSEMKKWAAQIEPRP